MLSIQENKYWIWISTLPRIGTKTIKKLLNKYGSANKIYNISKEKLLEDKIISEKIIEEITDQKYKNNLDKYLEYMEKENIKIITIDDKEYPQKLKQINDYPIYFYAKGNIKLLNKKSIAMVGSRHCTNYGKMVAQKMASELAENKLIVVSGLALRNRFFFTYRCFKI